MTDRHPRLAPGRPAELSVGVAAADPLAVGAQLAQLGEAGVGVLHFDVMDGRFAGPLTGSLPLVGAVADAFAVDVHLMVEEPGRHVDGFVDAGAHAITFHPEATADPAALLGRLRAAGVLAGVAVSPGTALDTIAPLVAEADLALVLGVDPRVRGTMDPRTPERVAAVRAAAGAGALVSVDGGVNNDTIDAVAATGCDLVVAGSAVFAGGRPGDGAARLLARLR